MITWMQKHKSWLVITIWISTIAFVGAGFVGWGSYDMSKSSGNVATVGSKKIEMKDLQQEYSNLYSQYQQMFGDQFNKELAEKLNLEELAYKNLVQKYLLLNLADDFGILATDSQVAQELVKINSFIIDGKFDKKTYVKILKQNRTNPTDFEAQIKRDLTMQKLNNIFAATTNKESIKNINQLFFASDKVSINIVSENKAMIKIQESNLEAYWNKNKENYKSTKKYKINIEKIPLGTDIKKSKNTALKKYLAMKKATSSFTQTELIDESTTYIKKEDLDKILTSKIGTILKPIKTKDNYIVVQLISIVQPTTLPYVEVKSAVKTEYVAKLKNDLLSKETEDIIKNFTGRDLGYISRDKEILVSGLTQEETRELFSHIFASKSIVNSVSLSDKNVVYKIFDTKLADYDSSKNDYLEETILKIKNQEILSTIVKKLELKYTVESNMQVKK